MVSRDGASTPSARASSSRSRRTSDVITARSPSSPSGKELTTSVAVLVADDALVLGAALGLGAAAATGAGGAVAGTSAAGFAVVELEAAGAVLAAGALTEGDGVATVVRGGGAMDGRSRSGGAAVSLGPIVPIVVPGK